MLYCGGVVLVALLLFGAWLLPPGQSPTGSGWQARTTTGTLGKYKFSSPAEVKAFNSEIIGWLSLRGYAPCTNATFDALAGSDSWKMPGLLFSHRHNPTNQVWVFIPECYHADSDIQIVGYHLSLRGGVEVANKFQADFSSTQKEFQQRFPSTWEYATQGAEDGAVHGSRPIRPGTIYASGAAGTRR